MRDNSSTNQLLLFAKRHELVSRRDQPAAAGSGGSRATWLVAHCARWVAGPFALLFASTLLALALQFRQLAKEIAAVS